MSEFLKFAYELLSQVVYNIVTWVVAFLKLFITGWADYFLIFRTYFPTLEIFARILSVLLMIILFAIPILLIVILVRHHCLIHQATQCQADIQVVPIVYSWNESSASIFHFHSG